MTAAYAARGSSFQRNSAVCTVRAAKAWRDRLAHRFAASRTRACARDRLSEGGRVGPLAVTQHPGALVELLHEPQDDGSAASWVAPALPACVGPLRRRLATFAERHTDSATLVGDLRLAVSEAITNAVIHAYRDRDVPGTVTAAIGATADRVEVVVTDVGMGISPRADSPGAGLGLTLMAAACDHVTICAGASGQGTEVRMTFALR